MYRRGVSKPDGEVLARPLCRCLGSGGGFLPAIAATDRIATNATTAIIFFIYVFPFRYLLENAHGGPKDNRKRRRDYSVVCTVSNEFVLPVLGRKPGESAKLARWMKVANGYC